MAGDQNTGRADRRQNRGLTCNSSATTMTLDMAILVILATRANIVYGPKVLFLQHVSVGAGFDGIELSAVPMRRATPA